MAKMPGLKIKKYQILTDEDPFNLARRINDAIAVGLAPLGGVAVALSESDDYRYVVYAQAIIMVGEEPDQPAKTPEPQLDWDKAKSHMDKIRGRYEALRNEPGVNTSIALMVVFDPLEHRYESGERSPALYEEMMSLE